MANCYNCGKPVSKRDGTETREHIPAQNLFEGFGDEYKKNRIVVPACEKCNGESSIIDEEFRDLIGTISERKELGVISKKTASAIITKKKQFDRLTLDEKGGVIGVSFDKDKILANHVKIFKGLYYHQYKKPIGDNYKIAAFIDPDDQSQQCINYLMNNFEMKFSGHPDILSYILQPFREEVVNPTKKDLMPVLNERFFMSIQKYNQAHAALVLATSDFVPDQPVN